MTYITIDSTKKNLGVKNFEFSDFLFGTIILVVTLITMSVFNQPKLGLAFMIIGIFLLMPINISNKNRVYKIVYMIAYYFFHIHTYVFLKNEKEVLRYEKSKKLDQFTIKF